MKKLFGALALMLLTLSTLGMSPAVASENGNSSEIGIVENSDGTLSAHDDQLESLTEAQQELLVGQEIDLGDGTYAVIEPNSRYAESPNSPINIGMPSAQKGLGIVTPFANKVTCGTRTDWYRLVNTAENTTCFSNKGKVTPAFGYANIKGHCPGANKGRFGYFSTDPNSLTWTPARGPYAAGKYDTCIYLKGGAKVQAISVQIY